MVMLIVSLDFQEIDNEFEKIIYTLEPLIQGIQLNCLPLSADRRHGYRENVGKDAYVVSKEENL